MNCRQSSIIPNNPAHEHQLSGLVEHSSFILILLSLPLPFLLFSTLPFLLLLLLPFRLELWPTQVCEKWYTHYVNKNANRIVTVNSALIFIRRKPIHYSHWFPFPTSVVTLNKSVCKVARETRSFKIIPISLRSPLGGFTPFFFDGSQYIKYRSVAALMCWHYTQMFVQRDLSSCYRTISKTYRQWPSG